MSRLQNFVIIVFVLGASINAFAAQPWDNGKLKVCPENRYLIHENGRPFFWLGETAWLLPQRLNRDEVDFYLGKCAQNGYNVIQIQVVNAVPAYNVYGQSSMPFGFDFKQPDNTGVYGYWDHMDYIIRTAARKGIYVGMVCIWGGLVKSGLMNKEQAQVYGEFLAKRYRGMPNIVWIIGGDIRGDVKTEVWEALAVSIKKNDPNHLMTFHPRGRTSSATWFNTSEWLDFNMFQSGHRRYGQRNGDGDYTIAENTEEDNWRYVEQALMMQARKPIIDGEPSYEDIPQGLHDTTQPRWKAADVRRYAYWAVFAGAMGHTYGHNSIMQFYRPGIVPAYGAIRPWHECLNDAGFTQMKHLKDLMLNFPYTDRVPDQTIVPVKNGDKYNRLVATRGRNYLLVYNYTGRTMQIDLSKISGVRKKCWWFNPANGKLTFIGDIAGNTVASFTPPAHDDNNTDRVLIAFDSDEKYIVPGSNKIQSDN